MTKQTKEEVDYVVLFDNEDYFARIERIKIGNKPKTYLLHFDINKSWNKTTLLETRDILNALLLQAGEKGVEALHVLTPKTDRKLIKFCNLIKPIDMISEVNEGYKLISWITEV